MRTCYVIGTTTKTRYWSRSNNNYSGDATAILLDGSSGSADNSIINGDPTSTGGSSFDSNSVHVLGIRPACIVSII